MLNRRRLITGVDLPAVTIAGINVSGSITPIDFGSVDRSLGRNQSQGCVIGVTTRFGPITGGGTVGAFRLKIVSLRGLASTVITAALAPEERLCYDSGAFVTLTGSNTVANLVSLFGGATGDPQAYSDGFRILADYTLVNTVSFSLFVAVHLDEAD